jgi:hypothetical protein
LTLSFSRVDGGKVFSATTGASGDYAAVLAPGTYRIELSISAVDYGGPRTIALQSGATVIANFEYRIGSSYLLPAGQTPQSPTLGWSEAWRWQRSSHGNGA